MYNNLLIQKTESRKTVCLSKIPNKNMFYKVIDILVIQQFGNTIVGHQSHHQCQLFTISFPMLPPPPHPSHGILSGTVKSFVFNGYHLDLMFSVLLSLCIGYIALLFTHIISIAEVPHCFLIASLSLLPFLLISYFLCPSPILLSV